MGKACREDNGSFAGRLSVCYETELTIKSHTRRERVESEPNGADMAAFECFEWLVCWCCVPLDTRLGRDANGNIYNMYMAIYACVKQRKAAYALNLLLMN